MSKFGWSYPAGAGSDPNAPYNQEENPDNSDFEEQFADFDGPYDMYRSVYKYTACGPSIGFYLYFIKEPAPYMDESGPASGGFGEEIYEYFYCNDLRQFGTWQDMRENGVLILGVGASSIVEGVDQETGWHEVEWRPFEVEPAKLREEFWECVRLVDQEAHDIWNDTHGCDWCRAHWRYEWDNGLLCVEYMGVGSTPVWADCAMCKGHGVAI